jgi:UDP-N-acetylmuramate-alanine ligase
MSKSGQVNIRMPAALDATLEAARGDVQRSTYILRVLEAHLNDRAAAIADARAYLAARGLKPEDL